MEYWSVLVAPDEGDVGWLSFDCPQSELPRGPYRTPRTPVHGYATIPRRSKAGNWNRIPRFSLFDRFFGRELEGWAARWLGLLSPQLQRASYSTNSRLQLSEAAIRV